jgi:DME family drug/metabolite transporter
MRMRLYIMLGALLFSTGGVAIKSATLTGWQLSCFRSLAAAVAILIFLPAARRGWTWRVFVVAIPYAATFTLFTLANKYTTAANAIFLQATAPMYVLLWGPLLLREQIRRSDVGFMVALLGGLALIFSSAREATEIAVDPEFGDLLAMGAGLTWSFTVVGIRWIAVRAVDHEDTPEAAIVAGCIFASVFAIPFAFPVENSIPADWLIIAYLGIFQIGLAYVFIAEGIRHLRAIEVSLLLLVEPVFSPIWVWLLLGESPAGLAIAGGALVLSATAVHAFRKTGHAAV